MNREAVSKAAERTRRILTDRLDHVHFYALYEVVNDHVNTVFSITHEGGAAICRAGFACVDFIDKCDHLAIVSFGYPAIEVALVGTRSRIYVFSYGRSVLLVVADDGMGDACFHCRWDQEETFGVTPHLMKAGLVDVTEQRKRLTRRAPARSHAAGTGASEVDEELLQKVSALQGALANDLMHEAVYGGGEKGIGFCIRNGRDITKSAKLQLQAMEACIASGKRLMDAINSLGDFVGELQEILVGREMALWADQCDRESCGSVVIESQPTERRWFATVTHERLAARGETSFSP